MPKIFISYRRDDTAFVAGILHEKLEARFGRDAIFFDVDNIPLGVDFRKHLDDAVGQCDVQLVLIGDRWLRSKDDKNRLENPRDFVRVEIQAAMARDISVIPVLVGKTSMPSDGDLPAELKEFAYRHAIQLHSGQDFNSHVERLIRGIEYLLAPKPGDVVSTSIGMKLSLIVAGEFLMGAPDTDRDAKPDEQPQHRVEISQPFFLSLHVLTQDEFTQVMGRSITFHKGSPRLPMDTVSWFDALQFCNRLSGIEGVSPFYEINGETVLAAGGNGYRLPAEAEWEYACRAGTTARWSFGDSPAELKHFAWFKENSANKTHRVGELQPNPWGFYDMHGNVAEWCWDVYENDFYRFSATQNPSGPSSGKYRVQRGSAYNFPHKYLRSSYRSWAEPMVRAKNIGFRVARNL